MAQNWSIIVPEETENLCTNPSFEKATTGWTATSSNTIAQSAAQQYAGVYSLLCTYQNSTTLATLTISSGLSAAGVYTITARVYVPSDWNGGDIRLNASGFTSATITQVREWDSATGETEKWVELEIRLSLSADTTGTILLQATSAPSSGRAVYLDAVQIEEKSYPTTYCDGDQPGCSWNGAAHAATSTRDEFEASGGRVMNLDTDFEFLTGPDEGTGVFPLQILSHPQPLLPGDSFQGINVQSRSNLLLRGGFEGETTPAFHAKRQALIKALNSRVGPINRPPQARQLIYHGAAVEKQIGVHYVAGLGVKDRIGTLGERVDGLQLYAPDPAWYGRGERGAVLNTSGSDTFSLVAAKIDGQWGNMGVSHTVAGGERVYAWAEDDTYIYIGGNFQNFQGVSTIDYIVRYHKTTGAFSAMPGGSPNGVVRAIAVAPNGDVYMGGEFTFAGAVAANRIARNNGSGWSALGTGAGDTVYALAFGADGLLYAGGSFNSVGGVANTGCVAKWNGSSWSALATGMSTSYIVYAIAVAPSGDIYFGGSFIDVGTRVVKWTGTSWVTLGDGVSEAVRTLVLGSNGRLYAGTLGSASGDILEWNGQAWTQIGDANEVVYALGYHDGYLYASGFFDEINGVSVPRVARWNGSSWSRLDIAFSLSASETAFSFFVSRDGDLYIGGNLDGDSSYAALTTVDYQGSENAYPVIEISRSGGTSVNLVEIASLTTLATLRLDYDLADGETITITLTPAQLSVVSSYYGLVPQAILPGSDTAAFFLSAGNQSGEQENVISCLVNPAGSPTVTAVMRWRDTYQSYD